MAITTFHGSKPAVPAVGDVYIDPYTFQGKVWTGTVWTTFSDVGSSVPAFVPPTDEQLEKFPSLRAAWEEFLVIKKVLGI